MKLKKIASLALAGIMAVSMLAGCNEALPATPPSLHSCNWAAALINENLVLRKTFEF